ncbi:MAG: ABC transporter permease [Alphaproteobacteria bacterium]
MNKWTPFEWIAALRFLREGRMQTLFIISGVSVGIAVIVFMSALLTGLQANLTKRVLSSQAHITLQPRDEVARPLRLGGDDVELAIVQMPLQRVRSIDQWQALVRVLQDDPAIAAVSPVAAGSALAVRGDATRAVSIVGIEPDSYFRIVRLPENLAAGTVRLSSQDIVIGTELARYLGIGVGDRLTLTAGVRTSGALTVTGIFDLGSRPVNERYVYVPLRTAQSLLDLIGGVTSIELTIGDVYAAETIARRLQSMTGAAAYSWIATNAQFFSAVQAQSLSSAVIRLFVALSVALGIASVLVVSVIQRSKDIGILRAMGTSRGQTLRIFLIQGALIGLIGAVIGSALGAGGMLFFHDHVRQADGSELIPLVLERSLFVAAALLATLTGVLAAMAPALRAARLDPVVAIRG